MIIKLFLLFIDINSIWKVHILRNNSLSLHVINTSFVEFLHLKIMITITLLFCFWVFSDDVTINDLSRRWYSWHTRFLRCKSQFLHLNKLRIRFLFRKNYFWSLLDSSTFFNFWLAFILVQWSLLLLHLILNLLFLFDMNHPFSFNSFYFLSHS